MPNQDRIQHRSIRGRIIDMEALRNMNAHQPAIGNASMNAQGDIINKAGQVVVERQKIVQAYNANNPKNVKHASLKPVTPDVFETPQQAFDRLAREAKAKTLKPDEALNPVDKAKRKLVDKSS